MRRLWVVNGAILLVVLLAAGGTTYALTKSSSSSSSTLRTTPVGRGTVAETVTAAGTVTTAASATLNFSVSGKIDEIRVKLGDHVTKGQVVARLDAEYADANLKAADAQISADEQALDDAEYQKDHPQSTQQSSAAAAPAQTQAQMPAATGNTSQTTGGTMTQQQQTALAQQQAAQQAAAQQAAAQQAAAQQAAQQRSRQQPGLLGQNWGAEFGQGVEDVRPQTEQTGGTTGSTTGSATGSTTGTSTSSTSSTSGTSTSGTSGASTSSTQQTSEDPGEANVRNARAKLDQDKAARINAQQATDNLDLVAPADGTVVSLDGLAGQMAGPQGIVLSSTATGNPAGGRLPDGSAISSGAGSGQSATTGSSTSSSSAGGAATTTGSTGGSTATAAPSAPAVMTIANLAAMQVVAQVPELDVGKVANAQPVAVSVNALPGQKIPGSVTSINLLPGSQATVQYGTAVLMPAPPAGLRPGMSASVSITTAQANDVTFLPSVAVTPVGGPDSGQATVQVLQPDGSTAPRTIGTGLASDTVTQVTSGLSLGDLVVLPTSAPAPLPAGGPRGGGGGGGGGGGAGGGGR